MWSVFLYGSECWTLTENLNKKISAVEMWLYRRVLKLKWTDKISNVKVLDRLSTKRELLSRIKRQQFGFLGHIVREKGLEWDKVSGKIPGVKNKGKKRTTLVSSLQSELGVKTFEDLVRCAEERYLWKFMITDVCIRYGTNE